MKTRRIWSLLFALIVLLALPSQTTLGQNGGVACEFDPITADLIRSLSKARWTDWIEKLSGEEPVTIQGEEFTIETRYTSAMQANAENAQAFNFVLAQVKKWVPEEQVSVQSFEYIDRFDPQSGTQTSRNLVVTFAGTTEPDEEVLLTAHLDSTAILPLRSAPGADDNATGSAALLEAARVLRNYRFERTVRLIWFTAEEQGLHGSRAYTEQNDMRSVIGVVNLDMFGYDGDGDRCFEMHVGSLPQSDTVGQCLAKVIEAYALDLSYDYLDGQQAEQFSDHASFWQAQVGAVGLIENVLDHDLPNGCALPERDANPNYHTPNDHIEHINLDTGFSITRAALAAVSSLAGPVEACRPGPMWIFSRRFGGSPSTTHCSGPWGLWELLGSFKQ
ncbi:MAG TPA: M28 family metallopeptidase [Anaerolineaceae bacterium]|nr:M28 family metallopeptidase [Anaerolineaceae bacterium]